jgi:hypothetical protein
MVRHTLAIDFGSKYVGLALVRHAPDEPNRVLYAATLVVEPKPLKEPIGNRADARRLRRTRKTHARRLARLRQALGDTPQADEIVRFCRRRGYSYDAPEEDGEPGFRVPRETLFAALEAFVADRLPADDATRVVALCGRHLNRAKNPAAELRPARFENRGRSRCQWEGCRKNVPRAGNDAEGRMRQSLFLWLRPVFDESGEPARLRRSVEHWVTELVAAAKTLRKPDLSDDAKRACDKRVRRVYQLLRERVRAEASPETADRFDENWSETYRPAISEIVRGKAAGRARFCREHSAAFVDHTLAGRAIPTEGELTERDLPSRTQQVVFSRIARLVEARLLPLAGGRIDRVVVERVAFDILTGPFKARQELSEAKAADLYRNGPQAGFASRREMLAEEFGGLCAYTGEPCDGFEEEHLFPRSRFPFDSYLNLVPASKAANARKGGRSAFEAGMTIHENAYEAYCGYLRKRKVLHPYHVVKKGLLKLLTRPQTSDKAERLLSMIASNLVEVASTQRSPRPLAKYLATRLEKRTGHRPAVAHVAGRHTALYRSVALPDYEKAEAKDAGDLRNHAIDAVLLGCEFASAAALENTRWTTTPEQIAAWLRSVRENAPAAADGLFVAHSPPPLVNFEADLGGGYRSIDLTAFNWNRRRKAAHKTEPYGQTKTGEPLRRKPAADVLANLKSGGAARAKQIGLVANAGLRKRLAENPERSPETFIRWLQKSVEAGLANGGPDPTHPADIARRDQLAAFARADASAFCRKEGVAEIPGVIGVRCVDIDSKGKNTLVRRLGVNEAAQWYQDRSKAYLLVGYRSKGGQVDRSKPVRVKVNQSYAVVETSGTKLKPESLPADSLLRGRAFGSPEPLREFRQRWEAAFAEFCRAEGLVETYRLTQGCVVEKSDGSVLQLRNFTKSEPWMKADTFRDIRKVHRSPLAASLPIWVAGAGPE